MRLQERQRREHGVAEVVESRGLQLLRSSENVGAAASPVTPLRASSGVTPPTSFCSADGLSPHHSQSVHFPFQPVHYQAVPCAPLCVPLARAATFLGSPGEGHSQPPCCSVNSSKTDLQGNASADPGRADLPDPAAAERSSSSPRSDAPCGASRSERRKRDSPFGASLLERIWSPLSRGR
jgi:hypothetical protein